MCCNMELLFYYWFMFAHASSTDVNDDLSLERERDEGDDRERVQPCLGCFLIVKLLLENDSLLIY